MQEKVQKKKIETALNSIDVDINEIDAVLVTHEHTDHIKRASNHIKKKIQHTNICK